MLGKRKSYDGMSDYHNREENVGLLWKLEKLLEKDTIHSSIKSYQIGGYQAILESNNVGALKQLLLDQNLLDYMIEDQKGSNSYGIRTAFLNGNTDVLKELLRNETAQLFTLKEIFQFIFVLKNANELQNISKKFFEPQFLNIAQSIAEKHQDPLLIAGLSNINEIIEMMNNANFEDEESMNNEIFEYEAMNDFPKNKFTP